MVKQNNALMNTDLGISWVTFIICENNIYKNLFDI